MKLLEPYLKYQDLFQKGWRFDPDESIVFREKKSKKTEIPEEFTDWKIVEFDKHEYLNKRLEELGISEEDNKVELIDESNGRAKTRGKFQIFTANEHGDIEILQYSLLREPYTIKVSETSVSPREEYYCQRRLNPQYAHICKGKYDYSDGIVTPFWHPWLIELYECGNINDEGEPIIETLLITEGQFKAFKACKDRIPTVGLTSTSHFRDQQTGKIHREIVMFLQKCNIQNVVILWDGDCREISLKDLKREKDLTTRPRLFYKYACDIQELISEFFPKKSKMQYYFATINKMNTDDPPKGIDDLLVFLRNPEPVISEIKKIRELPGNYLFFHSLNSESDFKKLRKWFNLNYVGNFYEFHQKKIGKERFIYYGSTYEIKDGMPVISIPADMKLYMRVGINYYKKSTRVVPAGKRGEVTEEEIIEPWSADAIKMDHGNELFKTIQRYEGFTNIASHTNYQPIIFGRYNLYCEVQHEKRQGDYPTIKKLLKHVFGERYDNGMIMDYLTILYRYPMEKLPIIVLGSEEQNTGKSTFINLLRMIFKQNMIGVTARDLTNDFTALWTSKLIVACEESVFEGKNTVYEMFKYLSMSEMVTRNEKNKGQIEVPNMLHIILATNYPDSFLKIDKHDSRLWIEKVGVIQEKDVHFTDKLRNEIPELIYDLETRDIIHEQEDRFWFAEHKYKTAALYALIKNSEPSLVKELREHLEDYFTRWNVSTLKMTPDNIRQYFGIREEKNYLKRCIKQFFGVEREKDMDGREITVRYHFFTENPNDIDQGRIVHDRGRPFVFFRENFTKDIGEEPGEQKKMDC